MVFNINRFQQNISKYGYLSVSDFYVSITTPPALQRKLLNNNGQQVRNEDQSKIMSFRIDQQAVPGMSLETAFVNRYGVGTPQFMPVNGRIKEWNFSLLVDHDGYLMRYWYLWLREIFQFSGTTDSFFGNSNQFASYEVGYKDEYSTNIQITMFDHFGVEIQNVILTEAFPVSIREIPMSWSDESNLVKLNISIAYTEYKLDGTSHTPRNVQVTNSQNIVENLTY